MEITKARGPNTLGARYRYPIVHFVQSRSKALKVQAPNLFVLIVKAQLRKRNPKLGGPGLLLDARPGLPYRIEAFVEGGLIVLRVEAVDAHPAGCDTERVRGPAIVKSVQMHQQILRLLDRVPATQRRLNGCPLSLIHARPNVYGSTVVDDTDVHFFSRRSALAGFFLSELGDRYRFIPNSVVECPINSDRPVVHAQGRSPF